MKFCFEDSSLSNIDQNNFLYRQSLKNDKFNIVFQQGIVINGFQKSSLYYTQIFITQSSNA